jgi:hypothetical protein
MVIRTHIMRPKLKDTIARPTWPTGVFTGGMILSPGIT